MGVGAGVAGGREELGSGGGRGGEEERERDGEEEEGRVWKLSCKTKEGVDGFMEHLEAEVRSRFQGAADDESPLITRYIVLYDTCVHRRHCGGSCMIIH